MEYNHIQTFELVDFPSKNKFTKPLQETNLHLTFLLNLKSQFLFILLNLCYIQYINSYSVLKCAGVCKLIFCLEQNVL